MKVFLLIEFIFFILIIGCTRYDTSGIKDNGEWVSIYDAPNSAKYILYNNRVYGLGFFSEDSIPWDYFETDPIPEPIDNIDISTLYINIKDHFCDYAKDMNYVYSSALNFTHCDGDSDLIIYGEFYGDIRIPGADPKTFKYLGDGYAVDKNGMYCCGEKIEWNDSIIEYYNK